MSQEKVELVRTAIEAFNRRDFDAALANATEDVTWRPFLSQTETPLLRGKAQIKAAWESQIEVLELRLEPEGVTSVGSNKVITRGLLIAQGRGSGMPLTHSMAWLYRFNDDGFLTSVESYETEEEALEAASRSRR